MVTVLAVSDEECGGLTPARIALMRPDLVVACGDLPWRYLEMIASSTDSPMVFVPGNHDPEIVAAKKHRSGLYLRAGMPVDAPRPQGVRNLDREVVDIAGLRVAGLGGCVRYRTGPHQYTQAQYHRRAAVLLRRYRRLARADPRPVDLLITHAPPLGVGDDDDRAHIGIEALHRVLDVMSPGLHLHGHIHPHGRVLPDRRLNATTIRNVIPYRLLAVEPR